MSARYASIQWGYLLDIRTQKTDFDIPNFMLLNAMFV